MPPGHKENASTPLLIVQKKGDRGNCNEGCIEIMDPLKDENDMKKCDEIQLKMIVRDEVKHMYNLAYPVVMTYVLEFLPGLTSLILVGQMKTDDTKKYVDAAALAVMYLNLTALSVGFGLATAMDTLCSQAYGAGNIKQIGVYFQTGAIVLGIASIPIMLVNFFCAEILALLQQPPDVASLAGEFTSIMVLGLPFLYLYELLKKVLQAQNVAMPMLYCAIIGNVVNVIVGYYLVNYTSCKFLGAAISRTVANIAMVLCLMMYLFLRPTMLAFWSGVQIRLAWKGIPQFIYFGLAGMLMMIFEWWSFEVIAILAGLLPEAKLAIGANAILVNITATVYMFYLGVAVAGNVRVGNALGSNKPKRAKIAACLASVLAGLIAIVTGLSVYIFRFSYPYVFTQDVAIAELAAKVAVVVAGFQLVDGVNAAVQGVLRGCALQNIGAIINFVSYIILGIPLGYMFEFRFDWGLSGLWIGMTFGYSFACILGVLVLYMSNWSHLAKFALERVS